MDMIDFYIFNNKTRLPKTTLKPKDYSCTPKCYENIGKQNPKEYLIMLVSFIESLDISDRSKLDLVNNAMSDAAKGFSSFS